MTLHIANVKGVYEEVGGDDARESGRLNVIQKVFK